jgi:hypothetical protein
MMIQPASSRWPEAKIRAEISDAVANSVPSGLKIAAFTGAS